MFCSLLPMRYIHAATRPIVPNDAMREAMLTFIAAMPTFWALGEVAVFLGL
jgi:hypothetical protein